MKLTQQDYKMLRYALIDAEVYLEHRISENRIILETHKLTEEEFEGFSNTVKSYEKDLNIYHELRKKLIKIEREL